jgi:hypothetical protein
MSPMCVYACAVVSWTIKGPELSVTEICLKLHFNSENASFSKLHFSSD